MFVCHRNDNTPTAFQYLCGLIQSERRNMERMEEAVPEADYQALQQFISDSPWDYRAVMGRVARMSDELLGGTGQTALIIDETAFAKKGRSSVGVSRQWNGRLGKVDNAQVAVCGVLSAGDRALLVDAELFLPEEWNEDAERCRRVGVPEERIASRSKPELALDIIRRQRQAGIRFDYVCADGLYGNSGAFCRALSDAGETFLVHVHANQHVYLENPDPAVPPRTADRGRSPVRLRTQSSPLRVDALVKGLSPADFERMTLRPATKGPLEVDACCRRVWVWDGEESAPRCLLLFIRREVSSPDQVKYCLTNAPEDTPLLHIARMEAQRFWIEHAFEEAKGQAGMAEYQVRGWLAWHHHMAMVMMALLFMTKQRMIFANQCPLLSCHDIKLLLAHFLPRRDISLAEVIRQMEVRHAKRRAASENAARSRLRKRLEKSNLSLTK